MISKIDNIELKNGLKALSINNRFASAILSLYGAQVLSYKPSGEKDLLWTSEISHFTEGKAIRGGVPICFPWFGNHPTDTKLPAHGFARIMYWDVESIHDLTDGSTCITLFTKSNDFTTTLWPFEFMAKAIIHIGAKLDIALRITNVDNKSIAFTDALHSYFNISDIANITIEGLENQSYFFGPEGTELFLQNEKLLTITKEENRRYIDHIGTCTILDKQFNRKIIVEKSNSKTTVVWNPWVESTLRFADMKPDGFKTMICVEPANTYNDSITLHPGASFEFSTSICSQQL